MFCMCGIDCQKCDILCIVFLFCSDDLCGRDIMDEIDGYVEYVFQCVSEFDRWFVQVFVFGYGDCCCVVSINVDVYCIVWCEFGVCVC